MSTKERVERCPPQADGYRLDRAVREIFGLSWDAARKAVASGKVKVAGKVVLNAMFTVDEGEELALDPNAPRPHVARRVEIQSTALLHVDHAIVVVHKPAGISTVPFGDEGPEGERQTLDALVREILQKRARPGQRGMRAPLGVVHRLDKETSGVMVFTRTLEAKQDLSNQFRQHTTKRKYLAIAVGHVAAARTIRSHIIENRGDGLRGSVKGGVRAGQLAITHVTPLEYFQGTEAHPGSATFIRCELETGRTHQIRIHLSEAGHPILGDRVYSRGHAPTPLKAPRLMLHAEMLELTHPTSGERMRWSAPPPADFEAVLAGLRARGR
ncbi:MAG: RluA family pseudouridine synthase [Polyangiaceae bacterium]